MRSIPFRIIYILIFSAIALFAVSGCASISKNETLSKLFDVPRVPEPNDLNSSAIAVSVNIDSRTVFNLDNPLLALLSGELFNYEKVYFDEIYLIKLDEHVGEFTHEEIYSTNFAYKSAMTGFQVGSYDNFLMNVKPGTYAAVGGLGKGVNTGAKFFVYFPEELIKNSIATVTEGTVSYMGDYILEMGYADKQMDTPDITQYYYFSNSIFIGEQWANQYIHYSPKLKTMETGVAREEEFLKDVQSTYVNPEWSAQINNKQAIRKNIPNQ